MAHTENNVKRKKQNQCKTSKRRVHKNQSIYHTKQYDV